MKAFNILTVAALTVLAVSCTKDRMVIGCSENEQPKYRISATIQNNPDTRTFMGGFDTNSHKYPVYWSDNDTIAVFSKTTIGKFGLQFSEEDSTTAEFVGDAGDMPIKFEGSDVYAAAYPVEGAFAQIAEDDGNLFLGSYLPYIQKYKNGSFCDNTFPMAGISTDGESFDFYNLCGIVQLSIYGDLDDDGKPQLLQALYLTGNKNEVVAGGIGMKFNPTTGVPIESELAQNTGRLIDKYGTEGFTRCMLDFSTIINDPTPANPNSGDEYRGLELSTDSINPTVINIAVIPQEFSRGITVEMRDAKNMGQSWKTIDGYSVTIKRSTVTQMKTFKYEKPVALQVANSYVYSEPGYYLMPAYAMGNRMDVFLPTEGRNLATDLLWSELIKPEVTANTTDREDLLPAITNIEYVTFDDGYSMMQFKINEDPESCEKENGLPVPGTGHAYRGNAVIALYDKDTKEIIWSWHIWMCEPVHDVVVGGACSSGTYSYSLPDGTRVDYAGESTSGKLIIMDRNLGAISANPADGWKTYGLYYQNGRRDPFIGGHWDGDPSGGGSDSYAGDELNVRPDETAPFTVAAQKTAPVWYNDELAPDGWKYRNRYQTISQALRNPMIYSTYYPTNGQWTDYTDSDNKSWMDPNISTGNKKGGTTSGGTHGNTGLSDGGHQSYWNRTKTIMDPCPVGYSVLGDKTDVQGVYLNSDDKQLIFETAGNTSYGTWNVSNHTEHAVYGMMSKFTYNSTTYYCWWPAAGVRTTKGELGDVGYRGMYYHYDHIAATHGGHGSNFTYGGSWATDIKTNHAASVRCVREKQFDNLTTYPLK